jgi:hypothetical protein
VDQRRTGYGPEESVMGMADGRCSWAPGIGVSSIVPDPSSLIHHQISVPVNPLPDEENRTKGMSRMAGVGIQFAIAVALCALIGNWIDRKTGSSPWGVIIGTFVGFAAGLYSMLKAAREENRGGKR